MNTAFQGVCVDFTCIKLAPDSGFAMNAQIRDLRRQRFPANAMLRGRNNVARLAIACKKREYLLTTAGKLILGIHRHRFRRSADGIRADTSA